MDPKLPSMARPALAPTERHGRFWYPLARHPLGRVLKFNSLLHLLKDLHGDCVLDYGSGDRPYEALLLKSFRRYIAGDHPLANKKHARSPDVFIEDEHVPLEDGCVDCVVLTEVLEHVYEPKKCLREVHRVLMPGGFVLGSVPFVVPEHEVPFDFHRYTYYCLEKMFKETGFNVVRIDYIGDAVAVILSLVSGCLGVVPRGLRKYRLSWLAAICAWIIKIPEFAYVHACRMGINPQRLTMFKVLPLGFTFLLRKTVAGSQ